MHPRFDTAGVDAAQWNDWRWQVRHRAQTIDELVARLGARAGFAAAAPDPGVLARFPVGVTPYYLSLIDPEDPADPVLRQVLPVHDEGVTHPGEAADPFHEERLSPVPGIVHRYPDRALLVPTNFCATLCRHCFRKRSWADGFFVLQPAEIDRALDYVAQSRAVRDVLITGGDPLHLPITSLRRILAGLAAIGHVEVVRIASRTPVTLPQRIDGEMLDLLAEHRPLWFITHFNHAREVSAEAGRALRGLLDRGITVQNQSVLLRGVNDSTEAQIELSRALLRLGVRPYYLHVADPVAGTGHLRVPLERGVAIVRAMFGRIAGFGIPRLVADLPHGKGKVPVMPDFVVRRDGGDTWFESPIDGSTVRWPDPSGGCDEPKNG